MEENMMEMLSSIQAMEEREQFCNHLIQLRNDFGFNLIEEWIILADYNEKLNGRTIH